MLLSAAKTCGNSPDCVITKLKAEHEFDQFGTLKGDLVLKTIRGVSFVPFDRDLEERWRARSAGFP